jgi:hypothetical protein
MTVVERRASVYLHGGRSGSVGPSSEAKEESAMKAIRGFVAFVAAALILFGTALPALASQPPGQLGYEGQPGNQGGGGGQNGGGLLGYEGQPGNQGG